MKKLAVRAEITDQRTGGKYHVWAYRPLSRDEAQRVVQMNNAQHKVRPARGKVVHIRTEIGKDDP